MGDDFDVDLWLDGYKPRKADAVIYARGDLVGEHTSLEAELAEVGLSGESDDDGTPERAKTLAERILAIEADLEASKRTFTFQSCGHERWYVLIAENPATDAETAEGHTEVVSRTFWDHAVAECSVDPKLTVEQAARMRTMSPADFDQIRAAVQQVNEGAVQAPKSLMAGAAAKLLDGSSTNRKQRRSPGRSGSAVNGARSRNTTTTTKAG